ncbi:MAG: ABC transporter permease [Spirochaetaceae bacterium]|jgi:putative spermidine/putrescine transport system permease protein|nr:ABC transporter permease [Spirochaetaceae bacterium]
MADRKVGWLSALAAALVFLFLMAPLLVIFLASFSPTALVVFPPRGFSLEWYANVFSSSANFLKGFQNSLTVAFIATAIDLVLGVAGALCVSRYRFRGRSALVLFFTSPMYIPSVAFAFVLLQTFSALGSVPAFCKILLGHTVIILPYVIRNTLSMLAIFDWTLEDAAASLGAKPLQVFLRVTLPVIRPGVIAGALLSFLYSFDEAVLGSLLNSPRFVTLPVRIMNYIELSFDPTLAAISALLILFSFTAIFLLERLTGLDMFVH